MEIDYKKTLNNVILSIEKYMEYKTQIEIKSNQSITSHFHHSSSRSNKMYCSNIERTALFNLSNKFIDYVELFENSLKELEDTEREIICRYFLLGYSGNEIAEFLGVSVSKLNKLKKKAIINFALLLDCEVYRNVF